MNLFLRWFDYLLTNHIKIPDLDHNSNSRVKAVLRNFLRRNFFVRYLYRWDKMKSNRGLGIFVIKQYHPKSGITRKIIQYIQRCGFEIIDKKELTEEQRQYFQHNPLHVPNLSRHINCLMLNIFAYYF